MKLNIGCGNDKREGFLNIDKNPYFNPDKIVNIENGLPFRNCLFDYVLCLQILEHIKNIYFVMREIHRVMKTNGILHIEIPYYNSKVAYTHPDHKRFFTEDTFKYFNEFKIKSIKKQRGKYLKWHIHGLKIIMIKT